jgi:gas vesicle structural protein
MAIATRGTSSNYLQRAPSPSGLAEVLDVILDKGLVIDAFVRVSVIGIELLTIDARIVIASVDTYLRFAEAVNRLDLTETEIGGLPDVEEIAAKEIAQHKVEDALGPLAGSAPSLKTAAKGAAAGAVVAGAAAAAKVLADRRSGNSDNEGGS